ncbi:MAG: hypothetical protein WAQ52_13330 [Terriglobales bacterium]
MKKEVCDQLISEAERVCQRLGGDLYEVMNKAPQVVEKWKRYYVLAQELWKNARTREDLTAFLLSGPDPSPEELETLLTFTRTVPYILRDGLQSAAKSLPPPPGGRPRELTPQECKTICAEIGWLYGQGVELRDAQKRMAQRYNKGLRTIQRAWQQRAKWKSEAI